MSDKQGFERIIELYTVLQEEDAPPSLDKLDCKKRKRKITKDTEKQS